MSGYTWIVTSNVGQFFSFIAILIDLRQSPDKACPFVSLGHADLLQRNKDGWGQWEKKSDCYNRRLSHLSHIVHLHLSLWVPSGNLLSRVSPSDPVECCPTLHVHTGCRNLKDKRGFLYLLFYCPTFLRNVCVYTSVSLLRFHRSRRPAISTQANRAGCVGDHIASYT